MLNWDIADFMKMAVPQDFTVSPDGLWCVYALRTLNEDKGEYQQKLWLTATDGSGPKVQLTFGAHHDSRPVYSADGRWIAFLSNRPLETDDGDDEDKRPAHLFVLSTSGGEARCVGEELGEIYGFEFSSQSDRLFVITDSVKSEFAKEREKALQEQKRDFTHEERVTEKKRICILTLDPMMDEIKVTTIYDGDYGLDELSVSHQGKAIVFSTNHTGLNNDWDGMNLYLLVDEDGKWKKQPLIERPGACRNARFSPDDSRIAFIGSRNDLSEHSQSDIWLISTEVGAKAVNVSQTLGLVADAEELEWSGAQELLVQVEKGLYAPLVRVDLVHFQTALEDKSRSNLQSLKSQDSAEMWSFVGSEQAIVRGARLSSDCRTLVFRAEDENTPFELFASVWPTGTATRLTSVQEEWKDKVRADVREFRWESYDGQVMEGVLVLPSDYESVGSLPLLVEIHGGPAWHTTRGFSQDLNWHWLANLGYAVFAPNYRGGIGYGQAYLQANKGDLAGGDYRDILTGVDAVIKTGLIDPERLGVTGGSYGGYMTNWIIGQDTRFKAAVSEFGIWSLFTDFGCSTQRGWEITYLGKYWENESLYLERSPSRYVTNVQTPVLIIHGDADDNTFIANSKEMYNALLEAGKTVEFVHYPREGHGILEPRHREDELTKIRDWFWHYLPTHQTQSAVPLGEWQTIAGEEVRFRVQSVGRTTDYKVYGEKYSELLRVAVDFESISAPDSDKEKPEADRFALRLNDAEDPNVLLTWRGTLPYQRPSVLDRYKMAPLGLAWPGLHCLVTGEVQLQSHAGVSLYLLFSTDSPFDGGLDEVRLQIQETEFLVL